ncbi:MAG: SDR family oxidoreductase [Methanoregula sp. SKADARSKE-2]|nr:MAG: SDR family oxidoreductase [Methanoregula sp. SKADARSKE-2]
MTQSVLLTGGLGYVGGRVAELLVGDADLEVFVTSRDPPSQELPVWLEKDHCLRLDLMNDADISSVCKDIDTVIHLAALNEIESLLDPGKALLVNGLGTQKLVRSAEISGVTRFIYFSTAHIYRSPLEGSISESSVPRPVHPYAISHRTAEDFVLAATRKEKFQGIVLRLSNSIGAPISPRVDRWSLIGNDLCRQAMVTKEMRLKTPGVQERDFVSLQDVGRAVSHMLRLPGDVVGDGIFNLGGEQTMSIINLAKLIQERCSTRFGFIPPIIRPEPTTTKDSVPLAYSIEKLKRTGFRLSGSLDHEIDNTLIFCKKYFSVADRYE